MLEVASMSAAAVALVSHIVFGGTARRPSRIGLRHPDGRLVRVAPYAVAVGFAIRARRLRQRATPDVAAAERWEEVGSMSSWLW